MKQRYFWLHCTWCHYLNFHAVRRAEDFALSSTLADLGENQSALLQLICHALSARIVTDRACRLRSDASYIHWSQHQHYRTFSLPFRPSSPPPPPGLRPLPLGSDASEIS